MVWVERDFKDPPVPPHHHEPPTRPGGIVGWKFYLALIILSKIVWISILNLALAVVIFVLPILDTDEGEPKFDEHKHLPRLEFAG